MMSNSIHLFLILKKRNLTGRKCSGNVRNSVYLHCHLLVNCTMFDRNDKKEHYNVVPLNSPLKLLGSQNFFGHGARVGVAFVLSGLALKFYCCQYKLIMQML